MRAPSNILTGQELGCDITRRTLSPLHHTHSQPIDDFAASQMQSSSNFSTPRGLGGDCARRTPDFPGQPVDDVVADHMHQSFQRSVSRNGCCGGSFSQTPPPLNNPSLQPVIGAPVSQTPPPPLNNLAVQPVLGVPVRQTHPYIYHGFNGGANSQSNGLVNYRSVQSVGNAVVSQTQPTSNNSARQVFSGIATTQPCVSQMPTTVRWIHSQQQPTLYAPDVYTQPPVNRLTTSQSQPGTLYQNVQSQPIYTFQTVHPQPMNEGSRSHTCQFPSYNDPPSSNNTYAQRRPKLHDLPAFSGLPEEWPILIASFNESTAAFGYTQLENMLRLQKSLRNEAKRTVENILIHPRCVPAVIEELETVYGRPECLIRSQLDKVRSWTVIPDNRLDLVMPFATKVQNLCTLLESLGSEQHLANPMLLELLVSRLPLTKQLEWVQFSDSIHPYPSMRDFCSWLKNYAKFANILHLSHRTATLGHPGKNRHHEKHPIFHTKERHKTTPTAAASHCQVCILCSASHHLKKCTNFQKLDLKERWNVVKKNEVCFSCLMPGHRLSNCRKKKCCERENCNRYHHILLHETRNTESIQQTSSKNTDSNFHASTTTKKKILFKVLPVKLYGPRGAISTFAFLDDGSSVSILNENIAKELGLSGKTHSMSLTWIGRKGTSQPSTLVNLEISAVQDGSKRYDLRNVRTHNNLALPMQTMDVRKLAKQEEIKSLPIDAYDNAVPQILIGLDNWRLIIGSAPVLCKPEGPIAVETLLGWVVYGSSDRDSDKDNYIFQITDEDNNQDELSQLVTDYFLQEKIDPVSTNNIPESRDDGRARRLLEATTNRLPNRFETGLLWKSDEIVLPDSLSMAKKRLAAVQRSLKKDPSYAADYEAIIKGYIKKGYARKLSVAEAEVRGPRTWYLPHFCVRNSHKGGKLRLVFDAAATVGDVSLNSSLLRGPEQCQDMLSVLHKFREKPIGVCADISEMFHQIAIRREDQDAQRFLWPKSDASGELDTYVMNVMVFGATCSPCSAEYIKNLNARRYADSRPEAVRVIIESHYVDDFVCSFTDEEEALSVTKDVTQIHRAGGFELRKFSSNSTQLLKGLQKEHSDQNSIANMDFVNNSEKILGMHWMPADDVFTFRLNLRQTNPEFFSGERYPTKRQFLSITMSIFDPFGLLADLTIHAKLMLQSLWKANIKWDDEIPSVIHQKWRKWITTLDAVQQISIPRCNSSLISTTSDIQLHILVDASEEAFAAAAYWRFSHHDRSVHVVAFVEAAVLGVRLRRRCLQSHNLRVTRCVFWSDSRTVLAWIKSADPRKYKPFVGHRIAEILEQSSQSEWRWISTHLNTADVATRSKNLSSYLPKGKWISGPAFLVDDEAKWPLPSEEENPTLMPMEELRSVFRTNTNVFHVSSPQIDLTKFSDYLKLKRVMAWILRALCLPGKRPSLKILDASELEHAEIVLCRMVQKQCYWEEYRTLEAGQQIKKSSHLYRLTPCLDSEGVIRLAGRIDYATCIPEQSRRPIILPKDNWLSYLIVQSTHAAYHHQNHDTILCEVRRRFWIPHLKVLVKNIARKCQMCKNWNAKPLVPQMGQLPEDRLTPFVRPFTFTGVDYMGPVIVTIGRRREKRWIALFTCLTIRAVHLELATDLSTDGFILCPRNFVNRRGVPVRIRSDNGTNFVGAEKELKTKMDMFDHSAISDFLSTKGIQSIFNCPSNPSAGGCWERLVRSVKRVLHVVLNAMEPKEDSLRSALIEAENIVNSRPLTQIPVSCLTEEPLTPNHFILGCANSSQTPGLDSDGPICLRKQWRIAQTIKNRFWHRWIAEYLPDLTRRTKWYKKEPPLAVGDLVIICESNIARGSWRRGRILKTFPGRDGQVRSAEIQTSTGPLRRPASKLARLDVRECP